MKSAKHPRCVIGIKGQNPAPRLPSRYLVRLAKVGRQCAVKRKPAVVKSDCRAKAAVHH
jgi:hypothetical protein